MLRSTLTRSAMIVGACFLLGLGAPAWADGKLANGTQTPPPPPAAQLNLKANGTGVQPDVYCSNKAGNQHFVPCDIIFAKYCKAIGGTYGSTANPDYNACFHRSEW